MMCFATKVHESIKIYKKNPKVSEIITIKTGTLQRKKTQNILENLNTFVRKYIFRSIFKTTASLISAYRGLTSLILSMQITSKNIRVQTEYYFQLPSLKLRKLNERFVIFLSLFIDELADHDFKPPMVVLLIKVIIDN